MDFYSVVFADARYTQTALAAPNVASSTIISAANRHYNTDSLTWVCSLARKLPDR
jgi:hypothetical protein